MNGSHPDKWRQRDWDARKTPEPAAALLSPPQAFPTGA